MRLLGFNISRTKAAPPVPVDQNRGGWLRIFEPFTGAWQRNISIDFNLVTAHNIVFACMTLIASDIAKLRLKLVEQDSDGIWSEVTANSPFQPVLRKPNRFQNRIQFWESYVLSKLMRGNTYVLLIRDARGIVIRQIVLAPDRVVPLVSDDGSVFYQLRTDNISGVTEDVMVPASEIIHDRFNTLFHPLVGLSPIYAAGVEAMKALSIQNNSAQFFTNKSLPGGILTAPGSISDDTASRLKAAWETNFGGDNAGRVAVVGDGLKYEPMAMSAQDSQLIEQLKYTGLEICSAFHVPPYKVGLEMPTNNNVQALNVEYYSQCLQVLIEEAELCQDEALGIGYGVSIKQEDGPPKIYGTEFDTDNLLRMDTITQMEALDKSKGILSPNEQRKKVDQKPKRGGDSPMLQQQNFSLEALAKRDAQDDPFATSKTPAGPSAAETAAANDNATELQAAKALAAVFKGFADVQR